MSETVVIEFLTSLGQALSSMRLYSPGHPARTEAVERVHIALLETLATAGDPGLRLTFLGDDVVLGDRRLRDLGRWSWGSQLAAVGVERLEVVRGVPAAEVESFLTEAVRRLEAAPVRPAAASEVAGGGEAAFPSVRLPHLRFGRVAESAHEPESRSFDGELQRVGALLESARVDGTVEATVAAAVVQAVGAAVQQSRNLLRLLVPLKEIDQYSTIHSMNVSVLSIGLAERFGYGREDVHSVGQAALLHDVGKSLVPEEILNKPGSLTPAEWGIVKRHPADGARILFRSLDGLGVAAVVAYEHHMTWDGGGYPERRFARAIHPATRLVQVCDVYDALRTRRPFRGPWSEERIVAHLRAGAGEAFSPDTVDLFLGMLESLEDGSVAGSSPTSG